MDEFRASRASLRQHRVWCVPWYVLALSVPFAGGVAEGQEPGGQTRLPPPPAAITDIRQLNKLSPAQARRRLPIHLEGVVTYSDPPWGLLFIRDPTGAAYVDVHGMNIALFQGMRVRVDAITIPGDVYAAMAEPVLTVKGYGPMPEPARATLADLDAGALDSQWVETTGVLRPAYKYESYRIAFRIRNGAASVLVVIPRRDDDFVERLIGARVRLRGVCGSLLEGGKRIGAQIFVSRPDDIVVEDSAPASADPYGIAATPIGAVSTVDLTQPFLRRIRVTGRVVCRSSKLLCIEDSGRAVPVIPWRTSTIKQGEAADVIGFPSPTEFGLGLVDAIVRPLAAGGSPRKQEPLRIHAAALKGSGILRLVQLRGQLIEESRYGDWRALALNDDGSRFTALLPRSNATQELLNLRPGALLEIAGVATFRGGAPGFPPSLVVIVSEATVLPTGTWLIWRYLLGAAVVLGTLSGGALVWITVLRRTVHRQVATIRERFEREGQLQRQYQRLFERNLAAVFRWRPDGEIVDSNLAFARMLGFHTREELIGRSYWEFELGSADREELRNGFTEEAVSNRDATLRRVDGGTICLLENITPVEVDKSRLYETTAIEVTALRRSQEELRQARDAAEAASRCKSEFLCNMSHEIRTPINGIVGMLDLVLPECAQCRDAQNRDYLMTLRSSADHLVAVVNDILDFSKIEAGRLELERVAFSLRDRVGGALRALSVEAHRKELELICSFASDVPDSVVGDPVRFVQVVNNLLYNAIKFTERGEVALEATVDTREEGWATVLVSVRDTGVGIDLDKQARIFESFYQADTSTTRRYGGTGLGLSISARLVELMGGRLRVTSAPGTGSVFSFAVRFELAPRQGAETVTPPACCAGKQVLVVDDNAGARRSLAAILTGWGVSVSEAAGGPQALEMARDTRAEGARCDLYVLDRRMPGMDGVELSEHLRRDGVAGDRIVLMTSAAEAELGALVRSGHLLGHMPKPVLEHDLACMLEQAWAAGRNPRGRDPSADELRHQVDARHLATRQCRVLLAEDNPVNQKVLVKLFEKLGCSVQTADNGREAVAKWSLEPYDVVFMDIQMPQMDGFEAVCAIREEEARIAHGRPPTPVVALTAHAFAEDREKCLKAGMDLHVSKPVSLASLAAALAQARSLAERAVEADGIRSAAIEHLDGT
jgi:PAS domain S-box-containing protein